MLGVYRISAFNAGCMPPQPTQFQSTPLALRMSPPPRADSIRPKGHLMNSVLAAATGAGQFQVRIDTGDHNFLVDEPVDYGGLGSGPSPFDLLCAALSACTLMTMKLYATRKGWDINGLNVRTSHQKGSADQRDRFDRIIEMGSANEEQRQALLKIAERCPVDLLLERGADVGAKIAIDALPEAVPDVMHAQEIDDLCREAS